LTNTSIQQAALNSDLADKVLDILVKSSLDLGTRQTIGDSISRVVRQRNTSIWDTIVSSDKKIRAMHDILNHDGCLRIEIPYAIDIVKGLHNMPVQGRSNTSIGNRREVEILENIDHIEAIHSIAHLKPLLYLAGLYLNAPALYYNYTAWWQYPMGINHKPSNAQLWHRDRDDFRSIALFIYGTDVDIKSGPHMYMKQTHRLDGTFNVFKTKESSLYDILTGKDHRFIDETLWSKLKPSSQPKIWQGPAGSAFLEDTKGFHKGMVAYKNPRLALRINWTLRPAQGFVNHALSYE